MAWADLDPLALRAWSGWLDAAGPDGTLASPFFRPELHALIHDARASAGPRTGALDGSAPVPIEAIVAQDAAGAPLAVLPFERDPQRPRHGWPAGRWLADYQGVVAAPGVAIDVVAMVKAAGLDAWQFDHVPIDQRELQAWRTGMGPSRQIDLRAGVADAATDRPVLRDAASARRRLQREVGAVRVDAHTDDPTVLAALLEWKSAQYRRTAVRDIFADDWCRAAVTALAATDRPAFAGRLSALWAGEHLVSVHLGPRSYGRWHWFLPAYDPAFGRYSPGTVLLADLIGRADELGISIIDLGKGDAPYKRRFANAEVTVTSGTVEVPSLRRRARRAAGQLRRRVRRRGAGEMAC